MFASHRTSLGPSLSLLPALVALTACAPAAPTTRSLSIEPRGPAIRIEVGAPVDVASSDSLVRTLYRDDWFGGVSLLGVDAEHARAVVRVESQSPRRLAFDLVDLRAGKRIERWEAGSDRVGPALARGHFVAISGSLDDDAHHLAKLLRPMGPWHGRPAFGAPTFAVGAAESEIAFGAAPSDGSAGDWLLRLPADHGAPARIDAGLRASYSPVFAPRGGAIAFRGCTASPCDYGLYLAVPGDARPHRVSGLAESTAPVWSAAGDAVYSVGSRVVGGGPSGERCLFAGSATGFAAARAIQCVRGLSDVGFAIDPSGQTAAIAGTRGAAGKHVLVVTWLRLDTGAVLATRELAGGIGVGTLGPAGLLAVPMPRGALGIADLTSGASITLSEHKGWFFGFESIRWRGETLVAARKLQDERGFELVSVDARAVLPPSSL